jgi:5'-methylthioadenosine phosphorylase
VRIGIIGGTGLEKIEGFKFLDEINISGRYGQTSSSTKAFTKNGNHFFIMSRHGENHQYPPHLVNYRANIDGFRQIEVDFILAFGAVGGINKLLQPGDFVIPDDIVDFTGGRSATFSEIGDTFHVDFTKPFCPSVRDTFIGILDKLNIRHHKKGVYVCTNGPRLESAAEIKMYDNLGFDVVGMTIGTEAALAREAGICFGAMTIVTNFAAGIGKRLLTTVEVVEGVKSSEEKVLQVIDELSQISHISFTCNCRDAIKHARFK